MEKVEKYIERNKNGKKKSSFQEKSAWNAGWRRITNGYILATLSRVKPLKDEKYNGLYSS